MNKRVVTAWALNALIVVMLVTLGANLNKKYHWFHKKGTTQGCLVPVVKGK